MEIEVWKNGNCDRPEVKVIEGDVEVVIGRHDNVLVKKKGISFSFEFPPQTQFSLTDFINKLTEEKVRKIIDFLSRLNHNTKEEHKVAIARRIIQGVLNDDLEKRFEEFEKTTLKEKIALEELQKIMEKYRFGYGNVYVKQIGDRVAIGFGNIWRLKSIREGFNIIIVGKDETSGYVVHSPSKIAEVFVHDNLEMKRCGKITKFELNKDSLAKIKGILIDYGVEYVRSFERFYLAISL